MAVGEVVGRARAAAGAPHLVAAEGIRDPTGDRPGQVAVREPEPRVPRRARRSACRGQRLYDLTPAGWPAAGPQRERPSRDRCGLFGDRRAVPVRRVEPRVGIRLLRAHDVGVVPRGRFAPPLLGDAVRGAPPRGPERPPARRPRVLLLAHPPRRDLRRRGSDDRCAPHGHRGPDATRRVECLRGSRATVAVDRCKRPAIRTRDSPSIPFSSLWSPNPESEPAVDPGRFRPAGDASPYGWLDRPTSWEGVPEDRLLSQETLDYIQASIDGLPPNQREVIRLRDVLGWSSEEVREALDLSATNQRVLLHRARSKVRAALERYFQEEMTKA